MRSLLENATRLASDLDHPAYDCLYLELAIQRACRLVTADERLIRKLAQSAHASHRDKTMLLKDAAG